MTRPTTIAAALLFAGLLTSSGHCASLAFVPSQPPESAPLETGVAALLTDMFASAEVFAVPWRQSLYCLEQTSTPAGAARRLKANLAVAVELTEAGGKIVLRLHPQPATGREAATVETTGADALTAVREAAPMLREAIAAANRARIGETRSLPTESVEALRAYAEGIVAASQPGNAREAEPRFRAAVSADPQFAPAHAELARALYELGQYDGAIAAYRQALAIRPDFGMVHSNLAEALLRTRDLPGAEAEARAAIASTGDPAAVAFGRVTLGNVYRMDQDLVAARREYETARSLMPYQPGPVLQMAALALKTRDLATAEVQLRRVTTALDTDRRSTAHACRVLGELYLRKARFSQAVVEYERAIEVRPDYAIALCGLGAAYRKLNLPAQAEDAYRRALELDNDPKATASAYNGLGVMRRAEGKLSEALQHFRKALTYDPENATIQKNVKDAEGAR